MTIESLLNDFELVDVAGRLSILEFAVSQMKCATCPVCDQKFANSEYRVIPCLCRMHTVCLRAWLAKTKDDPPPRICPRCNMEIEDDSELWHVNEQRKCDVLYHYGEDTSNDIAARKRRLPNSQDVDSDEMSATDEESPRDFYPRAKVPPQSPCRKSKARVNRLRRALTDGDIHAHSDAHL